MRVAQIINWHRYGGGSEHVAQYTTQLMSRQGHDVTLKILDSRKLAKGIDGKLRAFVSGIYSPAGVRIVARLIESFHPDIIHVHEVYPFFSPWIFPEIRRHGVPVVLTCHDHRLTCPITTHMRTGKICELCFGGKYHWCFLKNCRDNYFESLAYALRSTAASTFRLYEKNVSLFLTLTEFARRRLIAAGLTDSRISVLPNTVPTPEIPADPSQGEYALFVGRLSAEKGLDIIIEAVKQTPDIRLKIAGHGPLYHQCVETAPDNVTFTGLLGKAELVELYRKASFVLAPSIRLEGFPLVLLEAMSFGLPIITTDIGPLNEIIDDGTEGFTIQPGNAADLSNRMMQLWHQGELRVRMGRHARTRMIQDYSEERYYETLMKAYRSVLP